MSTSQMDTQSAAARRLAEAELRGLIARCAPAHPRLIGTTRRWLRKRLPTAHEVVYQYSNFIVISYSPNDRGYEGVLAIRAVANGVRLYFNRGKELPDPGKLLQGSGVTRWIHLEGASTLARPAVACLFDEAIALNSVPFAGTGRGRVVIRSVSAKKVPSSAHSLTQSPANLRPILKPGLESIRQSASSRSRRTPDHAGCGSADF